MSAVDQRREAAAKIVGQYNDATSRARRLYFDQGSFAFTGKQEGEFRIKSDIAARYSMQFRSVVFTGSSQLGFSPHKDRLFVPGRSDLDVACIDSNLYQRMWSVISRVTYGFSDMSKFVNEYHAESMKDHILKRGMILFDFLPSCRERTSELAFLDDVGRPYRSIFGRVSLAVYMSEHAFCWKQQSAISSILGR
jgi:hypothetical protein